MSFSQKDKEIQEIDLHLSDHWSVTSKFFDEKSHLNGNSYFVAMKIYFLIDEIGVQTAGDMLKRSKRRGDDPYASYLLFAEAFIERQKGNLQKADALLDQCLKISPNNKWFLLESYFVTDQKGDPYASVILETILKSYPSFGRAKLYLAYKKNVAGECQKIIDLIAGLPKTLSSADSESFLGDAYYFCEDFDDAELAYERSIKLEQNANAYYGLANLRLYIDKKLDEAEQYYVNALALDAKHQAARIGIAWLKYEQHNLKVAEDNFIKAYDSEKNEYAFNEIILFYLKLKEFDKAQTFVSEYTAKFKSNYRTDGYKLILEYHAASFTDQTKMLEVYNNKYGKSGVDWLNSVFSEMAH